MASGGHSDTVLALLLFWFFLWFKVDWRSSTKCGNGFSVFPFKAWSVKSFPQKVILPLLLKKFRMECAEKAVEFTFY